MAEGANEDMDSDGNVALAMLVVLNVELSAAEVELVVVKVLVPKEAVMAARVL